MKGMIRYCNYYNVIEVGRWWEGVQRRTSKCDEGVGVTYPVSYT